MPTPKPGGNSYKMARKSETLQLVIRAKETASKELGKVGKALDITRKRVKSLTGTVFNLKTVFVAMASSIAAGAVAKNTLATAMAFEKYETILKTITGSSQAAQESMDWITEFTAKTPYDLDQVTASFVKLSAYGFDPTDKSLKVLGDTAAGMGKDLNMAVEMFADAATGEFERLKEFGIRAKQEGDKVTFSWVENGAQMVKTAKKTQAGITTALIDIFADKYAGAMDDLSKTAEGMWSNIKDHFTMFQKAVMDADIFGYIKASLSLVLDQINKLKDEGKLDEWAKDISRKVISVFEKMLLGTAAFYDGIKPIISDIKTALLSIWESFKSLPSWVQKVGLVGAFLGGKTGKVIVAGTLISLSHIKNLAAASALVQAQLMPQELLNKLMWKPGDLDIYIKEWDEAHKELVKTTEKTGDAAKDATEPVKDFFKAFSDAETAKQKVQVLLAYLRELKEKRTIPADEVKVPKTLAPPVPAATDEAKTKSHLARLVAATKTALLILTNTYKDGEVTLQQYFDRRRELIEKQYAVEMAAMRAAAEAETDPSKRLAIEDKIFAKEETHKRTLINLTNQQIEAEKALAQKKIEIDQAMADLRLRAEGEKGGGLLQAGFDQELAEIDARHAEELQSFKDLLNEKLAAEMGYADEAAALRDVQGMQRLEKEKLLADQERRIRESQLENTRTVAGGMADIFENLYELTGKKQKEFFYLAKAAALAEAIANVAVGVTKALAQGGIMGPIMAGVVAAAGAVQIATITAQSLAAGGEIQGSSPSDTSDNIPISATAGEYMQPVKTVRYYGSQVMEAIRKRVIPREVFAGLTLPNFTIPRPAYAFAGGGPIPSQARPPRLSESDGGRAPDMQPDINIINVTDPRDIDQYLASSAGQNAILNVLSSRAESVRKVLR